MTYDVDLTGFPAERDMSMIEHVVKGSTTQDIYQAYLELMSSPLSRGSNHGRHHVYGY